MAVADTAHSSVANALALLGLRALVVPTAADGVFTAGALRTALAGHPRPVSAVVASAGSTNAGVIDDLSGLAEVCAAEGIWLHVDGAYGLAAPALATRSAVLRRDRGGGLADRRSSQVALRTARLLRPAVSGP